MNFKHIKTNKKTINYIIITFKYFLLTLNLLLTF